MRIEICRGSLVEAEADAIVNPANGQGRMGGGVAGAIKRAAGQEVEQEAMRQAPIPVGSAVATSGGKLKYAMILHAPTMAAPGEAIPVENVRKATRAALLLADQGEVRTLAFPGMGTGVGRVSPAEAARVMIEEIRAFQARHVQNIVLVDVSAEMVSAWRGWL